MVLKLILFAWIMLAGFLFLRFFSTKAGCFLKREILNLKALLTLSGFRIKNRFWFLFYPGV